MSGDAGGGTENVRYSGWKSYRSRGALWFMDNLENLRSVVTGGGGGKE